MLTGKCPPNSNSIFLLKWKQNKKKWNCSVFENLNKKEKKKQHEPLLIPASSLRSRLRCCGGRQPAASREPGGPAGPSGVPPEPRYREPRDGPGGIGGRAGAAGAGSAPSSQPGAPVSGGLFVFWKFDWEKQKNKKRKEILDSVTLCVSLAGVETRWAQRCRESGSRPVPGLGEAQRGQRAGAEPTPWARQSCCRGFNPCSEPTGNFFFFV